MTKFSGVLLLALCLAGCDLLAPRGDVEIRAFTDQEQRLAENSNAFGWELLKKLDEGFENEGVFISPLSISIALAMTLNGAGGNTQQEMREVLNVDGMALPEMNAAYLSLIALLQQMDPLVQFQIANSIWHEQTFDVLQTFIDTNKKYFDAEVRSLNFRDPGAADIINAWVSDKTNGLIEDVIGAIDPLTVMYLINAIYFKGSWTYEFDKAHTREADFTTADGSIVRTPLMNLTGDFAYFADEEVQIIDLPYGNDRFSMTVVLPRQDRSLRDVIPAMDQSKWNEWLDRLEEKTVNLHLPRFTFEYDSSLVGPLYRLGMSDALSPATADFTGINPRARDEGIHISDVIHSAFVDVNEEGTEAAAVTVVELSRESAGPMAIPMRVDRPFLFAIREHHGGTVLFLGKITDPS